jgi:hypothetical protein
VRWRRLRPEERLSAELLLGRVRCADGGCYMLWLMCHCCWAHGNATVKSLVGMS